MTNRSNWGGTRAQRARAYLHHRMRAAWLRRDPPVCPRCGDPILDGQAWDVGHTHSIKARPDLTWSLADLRPEHAACNRGDGARITNQGKAKRRAGAWQW